MISSLDRHAKLAVMDIKIAFHLLRVYSWGFLTFLVLRNIEKCMPFGLFISCKTWENFASFLHLEMEKWSGLSTLDHYLDEYIFAGTEHSNSCQILRECFLNICTEFGVPIATEKKWRPGHSSHVSWAYNRQVRVTNQNVNFLLRDLKFYLNQEKITLKNFSHSWVH